jgi:hypothetical protein
VERCLPGIVGKPLVMNVSGAIPCTLLDAGFPLKALKGVPLIARTASLVAHLLEEQTRSIGFILSHGAARAISYDGPVPAGFVAHENCAVRAFHDTGTGRNPHRRTGHFHHRAVLGDDARRSRR